jgi:hypothetical protein
MGNDRDRDEMDRMRMVMEPEPEAEHTFVTGAKRSEVKPFYDDISHQFLRRLALRCQGTPKGDPPMVVDGREYAGGSRGYGRGNWSNGLPFEDTFNHIIDHLYRWKEEIKQGNVPTDDDLAGAAWGIMRAMHFEEEYARQHGIRLKGDKYHPDGTPKPLIDFGDPHLPRSRSR